MLRLEADGPTSYVTSIAFAPDGQTLYAGSWDKTVYVWRWDAAAREFRLDPLATLRVPIGPGLDGAINTIAVSPDGTWVAAAGMSPMRGAADFRRPGQIIPTLGGLSNEMREDAGTIYVFNTVSGQTHSLRGHRGEVRALAFAPSGAESPLVVSAAREWDENASEYIGVVRVWRSLDDKGPPLQQTMPVPTSENAIWTTWPKLAARRAGLDRLAIEVAIAWGDETFRVWDVGRNQVFTAPRQGRFQDVVALHPESDQFFSAALGNDESMRVRAWRSLGGAGLELDAANSIETPRSRDYRFVARGLSFAASALGRRADVLCTVVHRNVVQNPANDQFELWLYRAPFRGAAPQMAALWLAGPPPRRTPQIATSPGGEHLAISREGEIYIYAVADLLAGNNRPKVLRNAGAGFDEVAFVRKRAAPEALGLRLREPRLPRATGAAAYVVFDLGRGTLEPQTAAGGWAPAPASLGNWRADLQASAPGVAPAGRQLVISEGGQRRGVIPVPAGERFVFAMSAHSRPPIVAMATYESGLPALVLFDAATGRQVRQLTSHSARIRSLAFSDDGQLLASVADDETVCLWRLADLDRIVGERGKAPGIAVRQSEAGLVVNLGDGAAESGLREGDILTGPVTGTGVQPWRSSLEFYDAFWNATPGDSIRVRRRSASGVEDELALPVVQGIDERKPLFSLFVTRGSAGQPRGWIAWSPFGPYQSSDRNVERYLGWHFNTGRPEAPVVFARSEQYREQYFRPGLIDALIRTGQPPEAKQANLPLPRPILELVVDGAELVPGGNADDVLVRKPPEKTSLVITDLHPEHIERVALTLDGEEVGLAQPQDDGTTWSAPLDTTGWRAGEHRLKAVVHTRESVPQQFEIERRVRYQAPPPQVAIDMTPVGVTGLQIDQDSLPLAASIEPGQKGELTDVVLVQKQAGNETVLKRWSTTEPLRINEMIDVPEGGSQLELIARNRNALPGFESQETDRQRLAMNRQPAAPLPVMASARVEAIVPGQVVEQQEIGNQPRRVTVDRVRLTGEISGAREDFVVESNLGKESAALRISPAEGGRPARFDTDEIKLQPGLQTIHLRRKQFGGPVIATAIELDYRPPLPDVAIERPAEPVQTLIAGRDQPIASVVARLSGPALDPSLEATLLVNGEPAENLPTIDREARSITAEVPLSAGENKLELKLWDSWNEGRVERVATIHYLHLPSIDSVKPQNEHLPVLELALTGESATPLTRVEVGSDVIPASDIAFDAATGRWQATARVSRRTADYELAILAHNRDGAALAPAKWRVPAWRQIESPPLIQVPGGGNVTTASYDFHFTVRSRSKLHSINVKHNRQPVEFDPALADLAPDSNGLYVFSTTLPVQLTTGDNRFEVLAANEGGPEAQHTLINYINPPARIAIDRIETVGGPQKTTLPIIVSNRRAYVAGTVPTGKVLVRGRVNWPLSTDKNYLERKQRLQLWVNGFQQAPGALEQPTKTSPSSEFTAFAVLNKKEGNRVQLALPDLTPDVSTLFDFDVDCTQPVSEQRLHVLIIGVGAAPGTEPELQGRVLEALQAKPLREKLWRSAAFDQIAAYGPLVGNDITPQQVRSQLSAIKLKIDELYHANRSSSRPANDVVMIYLQGGALINVADSFFVTTRPASDPRTSRAVSRLESRILFDVAVQSRTLANFLTHTTGAHVLMLDVTGNLSADENAQWPEESRAAMLRYTWLKGTQAPAQARLLAALPEALQHSSSLAQLDLQFAEYNRALASQFPQSSIYDRQVPDILQNLLLGPAP